MRVKVFNDKRALGQAAAQHAAAALRQALSARGRARLIAATGASQFEFLDHLTRATGVDWSRVALFHLDEYVGLPITHPASFRKYLMERLVSKTGIKECHWLDSEQDPEAVCRRVGQALRASPVDVAFVGIGENGHLAFNDPPADFVTEAPYQVVRLDEACRRQQVGEGWFADLEEVPEKAISMSVPQILKAREIIGVVPDARKAAAVQACFEGPISPMAPASILRRHPNTTVFLDADSAARLERFSRARAAARADEGWPVEWEV